MAKTCLGCVFYQLARVVDYAGDTNYNHLCWRENGCPVIRLVTNDTTPVPPACVGRFEEAK